MPMRLPRVHCWCQSLLMFVSPLKIHITSILTCMTANILLNCGFYNTAVSPSPRTQRNVQFPSTYQMCYHTLETNLLCPHTSHTYRLKTTLPWYLHKISLLPKANTDHQQCRFLKHRSLLHQFRHIPKSYNHTRCQFSHATLNMSLISLWSQVRQLDNPNLGPFIHLRGPTDTVSCYQFDSARWLMNTSSFSLSHKSNPIIVTHVWSSTISQITTYSLSHLNSQHIIFPYSQSVSSCR